MFVLTGQLTTSVIEPIQPNNILSRSPGSSRFVTKYVRHPSPKPVLIKPEAHFVSVERHLVVCNLPIAIAG